ncbi:hypothetical protein Droror1_Dr00011461 [Drosera rotundifolia]
MLQCLCVPLYQDVKKVHDYLFLQCCFSLGNYVVCMYICYVGWRLARSSCTFGRFLPYTKTLRLARDEYLKKVKVTIPFFAVGECGSTLPDVPCSPTPHPLPSVGVCWPAPSLMPGTEFVPQLPWRCPAKEEIPAVRPVVGGAVRKRPTGGTM